MEQRPKLRRLACSEPELPISVGPFTVVRNGYILIIFQSMDVGFPEFSTSNRFGKVATLSRHKSSRRYTNLLD